jgi:ABC-type sugar transport system ATPase subunit
MVLPSDALYPHMTVAENIGFPLRMRGRARAEIERAVREVAGVLGLEGLLGRRPRELSGGQRQRVALGRALVRRPRVFLMDEPLSNLDARLRLETRAELKRLHARFGITTIYVTHDQEEAMALSDRMALLERGRIAQCGPPLELYRDPASLYVASFIGSPPINVLAAEGLGDAVALPRGVPPRAVLAAMRPADVRVSATPAPRALEAEVIVSEPTGSELWVVGRRRGERIVGRGQPGCAPAPGSRAYFVLPPTIYLFERESSRRLR